MCVCVRGTNTCLPSREPLQKHKTEVSGPESVEKLARVRRATTTENSQSEQFLRVRGWRAVFCASLGKVMFRCICIKQCISHLD